MPEPRVGSLRYHRAAERFLELRRVASLAALRGLLPIRARIREGEGVQGGMGVVGEVFLSGQRRGECIPGVRTEGRSLAAMPRRNILLFRVRSAAGEVKLASEELDFERRRHRPLVLLLFRLAHHLHTAFHTKWICHSYHVLFGYRRFGRNWPFNVGGGGVKGLCGSGEVLGGEVGLCCVELIGLHW